MADDTTRTLRALAEKLVEKLSFHADGFCPCDTRSDCDDARVAIVEAALAAQPSAPSEQLHSDCHDLVCNGSRDYPRGAKDVSCSCRYRDSLHMAELSAPSEPLCLCRPGIVSGRKGLDPVSCPIHGQSGEVLVPGNRFMEAAEPSAPAPPLMANLRAVIKWVDEWLPTPKEIGLSDYTHERADVLRVLRRAVDVAAPPPQDDPVRPNPHKCMYSIMDDPPKRCVICGVVLPVVPPDQDTP